MANKLDGAVTLTGDLETISLVAAAESYIQWVNKLGVQLVAIFVGTADPTAETTLGGRLTAADAIYLRYGSADKSTMIYVTVDTGTTWTAITVA